MVVFIKTWILVLVDSVEVKRGILLTLTTRQEGNTNHSSRDSPL